MKYQDIVPFYQKLNYKCKSGTVDDSNRCDDNTESMGENKKFLGMSDIEKKRGERLDLPNYTKKAWLNALGVIKMPSDENGYYYHATTEDRLQSIQDNGLKPKMSKPNFPSEINKHSDELFFSKRLNDVPGEPYGAEYWSRMIFRTNQNKPVILRVNEKLLDNVKEYGNEYEYRTHNSVPANVLEILKHDRWIPIKNLQKQNAEKAEAMSLLKEDGTPTSEREVLLNRNMQFRVENVITKKKSKQNSASIKLNFRCPKGTVDDTFSCGKTPEEAKKNYEKLQKDKSKYATKIPVKKLENVITRTKKEIASGKISTKTKKELKETIKSISNIPDPKASSDPIDQMKPGEIWNAGPVGDIKVEKISNNNITITANGQTDTMSKSDLKAALKDYKIQKGSINPTLYMDISDKISDKFKSALIHYTEFDYSAINKISAGRKLDKRDLDYIPNERGNTPEEKLKYVNNEITILKDAFRTHLLPIGTVAYRGISKSAFDRLKDANVGDTINMKSFSSTTMTKDKAMEFSTTKDKPTVIKYNIPSGSRAIFVSPFSKYSDEQELVIDSDTKFRFGGIDESSDTRVITLEYITDTSKQNSTQMKLSMKHPDNWSTAASLDTKIKKELEIGIQDVLDVLKSVGYFKEDPKEVALNEAYRKIAQEIFDTHIKLNYNCPANEKNGSETPCSDSTPNSTPRSLKEINNAERLKSPYIVDIHFDEKDNIEIANNIINVINNYSKNFNILNNKQFLGNSRLFIRSGNAPITNIDSLAALTHLGNGAYVLNINKEITENPDSINKLLENAQPGHSVIKNLKGLIDHEMGHWLIDVIPLGRMKDSKTKSIFYELFSENDQSVIYENLSVNAGKSPDELLADAWSEYRNSDNPRPWAKKIGKYVEKEIKKKELIWHDVQKQNSNCKEEEKVGSGPGSCSGGINNTDQKLKLLTAKNEVKKYKQEYKEYTSQLKKVPKGSSEYYAILNKRDKATESKEAAEKLVRTYSYVHPTRTKEIAPLLDQSNAIIENASEHEQAVLAQYVFGAGNSTYQKLLSDHNGNIPTSEELAVEWADKEYGHYNKKDISEGGFYHADYMKKLSDNKKFADEIVKVATAQTAIVDRSITPNDIKIYTGISSRLYDQFKLTPGAEFQINQMTSASRDPTIAIGFAKNKNNNGKPTYLEINLQQGSRALALEDFALKENGPDATWIVGSSGKKGMGSQQEVLVGRKLQCTIKEIVNEGNIRKIVVDAKTAELK